MAADSFNLPNRRHNDRKAVLFKSSISIGGAAVECDVLDIGPGGIRISASLQAAPQTELILIIEQLGHYKTRVAWARNEELGLKFDEPLERIGEALEVIALYGTA